MVTKCISELNIVDINWELSKRGIETGGSKADKLLALEEYIRSKENMDPRSVRFGVTDVMSAQVPEDSTSEVQNSDEEVKSDGDLINQFMEQMLDRLEGVEAMVDEQQRTITTLSKSVEPSEQELAEEKRKSTERVAQASCACGGNNPLPSPKVSFENRWVNIQSRLTGENSRNRSLPEASGNQSGVSGEMSGVVGNLSGVSGEVSGRSHREALRSKFSGEKRVHFADSLLIPQDRLNMTRASLSEFAGKREEDPVRFLLQAEAILEETGIHKARWVTILAPQLKAQAGTWWGTMRALDLPWQEFKSELLEKFNGDELQSSLQSELLSTAQTKTEPLGEYVLHKYQLYRRLNLGLTEEAVVMTVVGLMHDEFRIHARIQRLKSFSELRALAHVLDGSKALRMRRNPKYPKQRQSSGAGCRVCGSHDYWQAACPKRKSESGNAKTTGGTAGSRAGQEVTGGKSTSRPERGKQRSSTEAVSNVPVQEPQVTRADPKKRNFGALRTGDSGRGPKKMGQKSSGPEKTGKNGMPSEKNFGHPKK
ncbi:activity-regulated cytoskeleton-associated protein-like [Aphis craccivora]|uniref:Activity-regulated cytoskeleton-associated protein-like n=1 Tax=Aphis craccivora TaxID=307492 RepID=A0A6G0YJN0_APHCR|nr:activity-regulated cytoskeleton-associated protein-like [Aphis craccivora]